MRTLKMSGLLFLMLATLAACSNTFGAAPSVDPAQPSAAQSHLGPDNDASRAHGW